MRSGAADVGRARFALAPQGARRSDACVLARRDLEVLAFVGEQYALRVDQLAVLLGAGERTAQRVISRLRSAGLAEAKPLLAGEPTWLWLTRAGARASGRDFGSWTPKLGMLAHVEAVTWVRLYVRSQARSSEWVCERCLLRDRIDPRDHVADGVVVSGRESHAVEVELSVKSRARTQRILDDLSQAHDAVVYFTTPATRSHLERLGGSSRWPRLAIRDLDACIATVRP
jgi:hypothetical protein